MRINTLVKGKGVERLEAALARGKGAIVLTGHLGNWELFGAWVAQNGISGQSGWPFRIRSAP